MLVYSKFVELQQIQEEQMFLAIREIKKEKRKLQEQVSHPMARHREMNCYL